MAFTHLLILAAMVLAPPQESSTRANSPDGRYVVYVVPNGVGDEDGTGSQVVVISDIRTGTEARRFRRRTAARLSQGEAPHLTIRDALLMGRRRGVMFTCSGMPVSSK